MHLLSLFNRYPLATVLTASSLICASVAIAGTRMQLDSGTQAQVTASNPHQIPDHLNPKFHRISDEVIVIKSELTEEVLEVTETVHSIAFQGRHGYSQPILDYTTGTSN
jgi:hypothetical protein